VLSPITMTRHFGEGFGSFKFHRHVLLYLEDKICLLCLGAVCACLVEKVANSKTDFFPFRREETELFLLEPLILYSTGADGTNHL
jgi:hypothetical protein